MRRPRRGPPVHWGTRCRWCGPRVGGRTGGRVHARGTAPRQGWRGGSGSRSGERQCGAALTYSTTGPSKPGRAAAKAGDAVAWAEEFARVPQGTSGRVRGEGQGKMPRTPEQPTVFLVSRTGRRGQVPESIGVLIRSTFNCHLVPGVDVVEAVSRRGVPLLWAGGSG